MVPVGIGVDFGFRWLSIVSEALIEMSVSLSDFDFDIGGTFDIWEMGAVGTMAKATEDKIENDTCTDRPPPLRLLVAVGVTLQAIIAPCER